MEALKSEVEDSFWEIGPKALAIAALCRIVGVIVEADKFGFSYGALPEHPERGEESFIVARSSKGANNF
jgi:uncharacterized protein (UPF0548 family)